MFLILQSFKPLLNKNLSNFHWTKIIMQGLFIEREPEKICGKVFEN